MVAPTHVLWLILSVAFFPSYSMPPSVITEPELVPIRLVLLADMGIIDVAQAIILVEGYQKVSVS